LAAAAWLAASPGSAGALPCWLGAVQACARLLLLREDLLPGAELLGSASLAVAAAVCCESALVPACLAAAPLDRLGSGGAALLV